MCLGNFLFPNFYIEPPTHIFYPRVAPKNIMTTKDYHFVGKPTYKKWRLKNRLSLLALIDTEALTIEHVPVCQLPDSPVVRELFGYKKKLVLFLVEWYRLIYKLPKPIYVVLQKGNLFWIKGFRNSYAFLFLLRQNGFIWVLKRTIRHLKK
jgi:hypothetical protein